MIIKTVTKSNIEYLSQYHYKNFGNLSLVKIYDKIKLLGFYSATNAGTSISIEELSITDYKKKIYKQVSNYFQKKQLKWEKSYISSFEKHNSLLYKWSLASEGLKDKIVQMYHNYNPSNNLFMMSFSGARGNLSQVKQIIGMRGLMADQSGNLIELPILSNFREGLTTTDYIVSAYGARKGVVDTALKTAEAGYLTRRLVFLGQNIIIKEVDCGDLNGFNIIKKKELFPYVVGKEVINIEFRKIPISPILSQLKKKLFDLQKKKIIDSNLFKAIKNSSTLIKNLAVRSIASCKSYPSICQKCYGFDYSKKNRIPLGEAVGVSAGQFIGEPGTQLTMRTFHTGGVVTLKKAAFLFSAYSGFLEFPTSIKKRIASVRTEDGHVKYQILTKQKCSVRTWKNMYVILTLNKNNLLSSLTSRYIAKGEILGEYARTMKTSEETNYLQSLRYLKTLSFYPEYSSIDAIIIPRKISIRNFKSTGLSLYEAFSRHLKSSRDSYSFALEGSSFDNVLFKSFSTALGNKFNDLSHLNKGKIFSKLSLVSSHGGALYFTKKKIYLVTNTIIKKLCFFFFEEFFEAFYIQYSSITRSYQHIDNNTIIGFLLLFSLEANNTASFAILK